MAWRYYNLLITNLLLQYRAITMLLQAFVCVYLCCTVFFCICPLEHSGAHYIHFKYMTMFLTWHRAQEKREYCSEKNSELADSTKDTAFP